MCQRSPAVLAERVGNQLSLRTSRGRRTIQPGLYDFQERCRLLLNMWPHDFSNTPTQAKGIVMQHQGGKWALVFSPCTCTGQACCKRKHTCDMKTAFRGYTKPGKNSKLHWQGHKGTCIVLSTAGKLYVTDPSASVMPAEGAGVAPFAEAAVTGVASSARTHSARMSGQPDVLGTPNAAPSRSLPRPVQKRAP